MTVSFAQNGTQRAVTRPSSPTLSAKFAQLPQVTANADSRSRSPLPPPLWMDVPSRKRPAFAGMTGVVHTSLDWRGSGDRDGWRDEGPINSISSADRCAAAQHYRTSSNGGNQLNR